MPVGPIEFLPERFSGCCSSALEFGQTHLNDLMSKFDAYVIGYQLINAKLVVLSYY